MILLDTCVLARLADLDSPDRPQARRAVFDLTLERNPLVIVPQNLCEFWCLATRARGLASKEARTGSACSRHK